MGGKLILLKREGRNRVGEWESEDEFFCVWNGYFFGLVKYGWGGWR